MSIQKQVGLVPSEGLVAKNHSSITQFDAVAGLSAAEKQELNNKVFNALVQHVGEDLTESIAVKMAKTAKIPRQRLELDTLLKGISQNVNPLLWGRVMAAKTALEALARGKAA